MASSADPPDTAPVKVRLEQALFEIRRVISGQDQMLERVLVCLLTGGHLLIEGVPGLAKTLTVKTTADVLGGTFKRIQFTPDLVPSDLIGTRIYRPDTATFDTELGPVFCNFLLADEINRAPAKVQSALLEVMQERQVTLGHTTHPVPDPFLVMATQNPIESEGTYPLPEAQVDRFMLKILDRLPPARRGADGHPALAGGAARSCRSCSRSTSCASVQETVRDIYVDPGPRQLRARARDRDAPAGRVRAARAAAVHLVRREPARPDLADPRGARPRGGARARLRAGAGRAGADQGRVPPPARALLRGARRATQRRQHARRRDRRREGARTSTCPARPRDRRAAPPRADGGAARSGPDAGAAPARARPDDRPQGRGPPARRPQLVAARARHRARADPARTRPVEDDVRQIDWNVTARTGTPHVRIHLAERALVTWLLLDTSASMRFGTAERRKADVAEGASLAIGYAATRRGNRLGLVTFGDDTPRTLPARQGRAGPARAAARAAHGGGRGQAAGGRGGLDRRGDAARRQHGAPARATSSSSPTSADRATGAARCSRSAGATTSSRSRSATRARWSCRSSGRCGSSTPRPAAS